MCLVCTLLLVCLWVVGRLSLSQTQTHLPSCGGRPAAPSNVGLLDTAETVIDRYSLFDLVEISYNM